MNITTLMREAISNLLSNKVRSLLTMLGIFIGVGAVIAMMSVGLGAKDSISSQMSQLGADSLYVYPGNFSESVRNIGTVTTEDAAALAELKSIDSISPTISGQQVSISRAGKKTSSLNVTGVTPTFQAIENYTMASGRFFTQDDLDRNDLVTVIGSEVGALFFETGENPIGQTLRINGQPYEIIGVFTKKGAGGMGGTSVDQGIYLPLTTAYNRLFTRLKGTLNQIVLKTKSGYTSQQAVDDAKALMRERHNILEGKPDDFSVVNLQEMVTAMNSVMSTFVLFLGGVAGISLLVGGIGIMNIMLVTVTERTREIGLRKALGAKNRDIQVQFLVESSVLSMLGGILGIIFGYLLAFGIAALASNAGTKIVPAVNLLIIIGTTLFSIGIGLFFGIYPASRAAKLDPVIALRTE
jgi:putative ABC transport system permease protein